MRRILVGAAILVVGLLLLGGGGWYVWTLQRQQRDLSQHLVDTQADLAARQEALAMLEAERRKLSESYETLKTRWTQCDQQLQQLTKHSAQLETEHLALSSERSALQRQLDDTTQARRTLESQADALRQELALKQTEQAALHTQLTNVAERALSPAEVEQLLDVIASHQRDAELLNEHIAALSRAYEQLVQAQPPVKVAKRTQTSSRESRKASMEGPSTSHESPLRPRPSELRRAAAKYRAMGESYFVTHHYPEAAESFEQSLVLHDDPEVHAKLVFLYTRFLGNPDKAAEHEAQAGAIDPVQAGLGSYAQTQGLPRRGWRTVRDWLAGR